MAITQPFQAVLDGITHTTEESLRTALKERAKNPRLPKVGPGRHQNANTSMWPARITLTKAEKAWLGATVDTPHGTGEVWCVDQYEASVVISDPDATGTHRLQTVQTKNLVLLQDWRQRSEQDTLDITEES